MLIVDRNCLGCKDSHKVDFSAFNVRFTVQKGGVIDLEKSVPINKNEKMGDLNRVAAELLGRSQYEQVPMKELKSDPPKKADTKNPEAKTEEKVETGKTEQPVTAKGKDGKKK